MLREQSSFHRLQSQIDWLELVIGKEGTVASTSGYTFSYQNRNYYNEIRCDSV